MNQTVLPETVILTSLCFVDMAWTIAAIQLGMARESNPLMAVLIHKSIFLFALMKMVSFLFPLTCLELLRAKIPQFVTLSIRIGLALYVGVYIVGSLRANGIF